MPATDQRGLPRSGPIDIRAFQTEPGLIVNTPSDGVTSEPGTLNLRDAINLANTLPTADTITFSSLFNTPQTIDLVPDQQLELTDKATTTINGPGAGLADDQGRRQQPGFLPRRCVGCNVGRDDQRRRHRSER